MGVKRYLLLLLLMPLLAYSGPISGRRDSLTLVCMSQLGAPDAGDGKVTEAAMHRLINRAYLQVCHDFPAIEKFDTVVVDDTMEGGSLNTDFRSAMAVYKMNDSLRVALRPVSPDEIRLLLPTESDQKQDKKSSMSPHYYSTWGDKLMLAPRVQKTSSDPDSFLVQYYAIGDPLLEADSTLQCKDKFFEAVVLWACSKAAALRNNLDDAAFFMAEYRAMKTEEVKPREAEGEK